MTDKKQPNWQKALDELAAGASGPFFFQKAPKAKIRLVNLEHDPEKFFLPVTSNFRGTAKTKYLVFGVVIATEGQELSEKWRNAIVPIVLTKTAVKAILTLLAEGYDLFDPKAGFGITIIKTGRGLDTDYNIMPSPKEVPVNMDSVKQPEKTLEDYANEFSARQASRANGEDSGAETGW